MKHSLIVSRFAILFLLSFCISCEAPKQSVSPKTNTLSQQDFIASISQVWIDTVSNTRKIVLANIEGSNSFIGTDERYVEEGIINLNGVTKNFELNWTTMIKIKQTDFPRRYITYKGILTDTASTHKRMIAYSLIDTVYLKALPLPAIKNQTK